MKSDAVVVDSDSAPQFNSVQFNV